ncbi:MAG TPA: DNA polymerase III subunit gamma/tau, partial [Chitinophagaceae bacterium]|nr:DNA polymerase III subunit gamma/tau [Chitinophagaceae bacterium]
MSDQYIVSARKYRPQTFDTVVGQEHITTTLKNAMRNNHLAHAFLFCGPRGVGKTTCARILAKTLNCEHPTADMEACGTCSNCQSFSNNTSFNVFELDAASNNSVDDIRSLTEQVRFAPQQGKYKVYIIDEVHMLSTAAFNAFLKTLEEPPSYAIFILATTEKHKILPTILSRCQVFDFKRITTNDTVAHLQQITHKEGVQAEEAALHVIAQKSEGCMRDALSILDRISSFTNGHLSYAATMEHLNQLDADFYFKITDHILAQDVAGTLLLLDDVLDRGFEGDMVLSGFAEHFRNLLLCKDARMAKLLDVPNNHKPIYHEKAAQAPPSFILTALNVVNESVLEYKNAGNRRLHTELCLIRLCYILQATGTPGEKKNISAEVKTTDSLTAGHKPVAPASTPAVAPVTEIKPQEPETVLREAPVSYNAEPPVATAPAQPAHEKKSPFGQVEPVAGMRRISRNMAQVQAEAASGTQQMAVEDLTLERVETIFAAYKVSLKDKNQSILSSAFETIKLEMPEVGTIHLVSPNPITDSYAQAERAALQELIRQETGLLLRFTNECIETDEEPVEKALTKNEIFAAMSAKNPSLAQLRDVLKMS